MCKKWSHGFLSIRPTMASGTAHLETPRFASEKDPAWRCFSEPLTPGCNGSPILVRSELEIMADQAECQPYAF